MIGPHVIQADIVADLKATAAITDLLASASEVREDEYQGTVWDYPTLRVAVLAQIPRNEAEQCDLASLSFTIKVFTEGGSSKSNSQILTAINDHYHRDIFSAATWQSVFRSAGLAKPSRARQNLWRGEAMFEGTIYPR